MRRVLLTVTLAHQLCGCAPSSPESPLESETIATILTVSTMHIKTNLQSGPVALSPRVAHRVIRDETGAIRRLGRGAEPLRDAAILQTVAASAAVRIADRGDIVLCANQSPACRDRGVVAHIRMSDPQVDGDIATLSYGADHHQEQLSPRAPDWWGWSAILTLMRKDGAWHVTHDETLVSTH